MGPFRAYGHRLRQFGRNARLYLGYTFLSGLGFAVYRLFFNLYVLALGYEPAFLGVLVGLPALVATVFAVPAGLLGDRFGHRKVLLSALGLVAASLIVIVAFPTRAALLAFGVGFGLSRTLIDVVNAPFMVAHSGDVERTHLFSVQFSARTLSGFFGSLVAGGLPALFAVLLRVEGGDPAVYRGTLLVGALIFLASALPLLRLDIQRPNSTSRTRSPRPRLPLGEVLRACCPMLRFVAPHVVVGLGAGALIPFLNVFFKMEFDVSDSLLGALFAGQSLFIGVATLLGPALAERLGKIRAVVLTQVVSIPFLITLGFSPLLGPAVAGFLIRAGLMNLGNPLYFAFVMEEVEAKRRATASALLIMSWQGSWAVSSWASGQLQQGPGFAPIFALTCVAYLAASLVMYLYFVRRGQETHRSATNSTEEPGSC
ncbi:MAG: MFS transporter [Candidatus Bipolaricaulota bacterium]